ncbi:MAG: PH domain-containing protein [Nitrososphaerota archaeon]|jgi:hypothetical protein|nr:PH domain-containing protein [Nitrososphaerota archaeon]
MPIDDFLTPGEEIRFSSTTKMRYGEKRYQVFITNKRLIMYARRGTLMKSDDLVSIPLEEFHNVKYREEGLINRSGIIEFEGKTLVQMYGPPRDAKAIYQQIMQFI